MLYLAGIEIFGHLEKVMDRFESVAHRISGLVIDFMNGRNVAANSRVSCNSAMALGTLLGGWRIIHTMGSRITRLSPMQGVCAETAGSITLFAATHMGIPASTTQTITGAIVGAFFCWLAGPVL